MKIGVLSDTHDNVRSIAKAMEIFRLKNATMIIHCGDWVAPFAVEAIGTLAYQRRIPVYGVLGNNLGDQEKIFERNSLLAAPVHLTKQEFLELPIQSKKLVVHHGHNQALLSHLSGVGSYDFVLTGHTHLPAIKKHGATLVVNPGATCFVQNGQIVEEATVAILDTTMAEATIETYRWEDI